MRNLRTEQEIMANWKGDLSKPVVSVCCITYNHENYIEDALEGFLIQETEFPFEIIIHDDASTDKTASIIQEYVEKYPKIIKPILQSENQYREKGFSFIASVYKMCVGEYIALCEGDDYWITPDKIALQVSVMRSNENISMVFSSAIQKQKGKKDFIRNKYPKEGILNVDLKWVIKKGGGFYPTASIIFRSSVLINPPTWLWMHVTGDYPLAILCKMHGEFFYFNDAQTVYNSHEKSVSHEEKSIKVKASNMKKNQEFYWELFKSNILDYKDFIYFLYKENLSTKSFNSKWAWLKSRVVAVFLYISLRMS